MRAIGFYWFPLYVWATERMLMRTIDFCRFLSYGWETGRRMSAGAHPYGCGNGAGDNCDTVSRVLPGGWCLSFPRAPVSRRS